MNLDVFEPLDFDEFHAVTLPEAAAKGTAVDGHLDGLPTLSIELLDGRSASYRVTGGRVEVLPGELRPDATARLDEQAWQEFALELRSSYSLLYSGKVEFPVGRFGALERWEPVLRGLLDGRPLADPQADELTDLQGRPLDLTRSFRLEDDPAGMSRFVEQAGYLHVEGVFDAEEIAELSAETERLRDAARPDDGRSWWARTADGEERCCRLNYANEGSQAIADVTGDGRLDRLVALSGEEVRHAPDRLDGNTVVIKLPDATEGLADLPWHRDCGMGGHPVLCPEFNVGVQLDDATAGSGQLHVLPGSHRSSSKPPPSRGDDRTVVPLDTRAGDVTLHYGHLMHAAPSPSGAGGRRALYCTYVQERAFEYVPAGRAFNDVLFEEAGDGRIASVGESRTRD